MEPTSSEKFEIFGAFESSTTTPMSSKLAQMLLTLKATDSVAFDKLMTPGDRSMTDFEHEVKESFSKVIKVRVGNLNIQNTQVIDCFAGSRRG